LFLFLGALFMFIFSRIFFNFSEQALKFNFWKITHFTVYCLLFYFNILHPLSNPKFSNFASGIINKSAT